ncbi:MAG: hypothetical protein IVW53_09605 [Chloroflexi bacterium]|nr:hypothetical protein [Chloroflexota bacterium]
MVSSVDSRVGRSVSFAAPDPATAAVQPRATARPPIAVGPGRPASAAPIHVPGNSDVNSFPIDLSKVRSPALRDETLTRDRLLDWLDAKIHHRLVLVTAEAGYGKTTLLADFSRRTRIRTLWYRLDETDRDWVTFLNHLVAAGRVTDPGFAPSTWSLLGELGTGGAPMMTIVATFIRELARLADHGSALILDDYHAVESVADIQAIVREIVTRAPERLAVVIASRHQPSLPTARLRTLGEVVELTREDLRFEPAETERLFRETYGRPLDADVLSDLDARTQGWAASLRLVQAALRERSMAETRAFIRALSGARGSLHDYLAEEIVGDLDPAMQSFLMRTAILTDLAIPTAAHAASVVPEIASTAIDEAARVGLLPRAEDSLPARYHPLVREFLEERLRREIGAEGIAALHRSVARHGERSDWKLAAHHFAAAGDLEDLHRVLVAAIGDIMGGGGFALAESYVDRYPELGADPTFGLFLSRRDLYNGDFDRALARAESAVDAFPPDLGNPISHFALANLSSVLYSLGEIESAVLHASDLLRLTPAPELDDIANGILVVSAESVDGSLVTSAGLLERALVEQHRRGHAHYEGISHLNLACNLQARGSAEEALEHADHALRLLASTSSGSEIPSVHAVRAWALHHLGRTEEGMAELQTAISSGGPDQRMVAIECAELEALYGSPVHARALLQEIERLPKGASQEDDYAHLVWAVIADSPEEVAWTTAALLNVDPARRRGISAYVGRWHLALARLEAKAGRDPSTHLVSGRQILQAQHAIHWLKCAEILSACFEFDPAALNGWVERLRPGESAYLSICAEAVVRRLDDLSVLAAERVQSEAAFRPERWRPALRRALETEEPAARGAAALLDVVGDARDVRPLRRYSKAHRGGSSLGRGLAQRLAPQARISDLGRVVIRVHDREIDSPSVRRKVLSLVCFLLTKSGFASTRDQVLEALWPSLDPSIAVNSLNQTVYFLRRVFDPRYKEDESPNYVYHDGEIVRLDRTLVTSQSAACLALIEEARSGLSPEVVDRLSLAYVDQFAMDFEYEDWSAPFRQTLHAAYLDVVEQAIRADTEAGHFDRAAVIARRALAVDPDAEPIEGVLLRIYRTAGSHAAASEQHSHYVSFNEEDGA